MKIIDFIKSSFRSFTKESKSKKRLIKSKYFYYKSRKEENTGAFPL